MAAEVETISPKQQPIMGIIEAVHEYYMEIGRQQGLQKGLKQGLKQGRQEAEAMRKEFVTRLVEAGYPDTEIIKFSCATQKLVKTARKELTKQPKG